MPQHLTRNLAIAAFSTLSALSLGSAHAQDKPVNLKLGSWVPAQHALNPALIAWGESLKAASGGTITATLFPSEQLGKAFDHYDMARDGIADVSYVNPGYQPGRFPIFAAASLPFMVGNAKAGSAAIDAWYRAYAAKEMKDVHFCFAFAHDWRIALTQKDCFANRDQGHESSACFCNDRSNGHPAWWYQRASFRT